MTRWQGAGGGGLDTPKIDDIIYEQPLMPIVFADSAEAKYCSTFHFPCGRPSVHRRDVSYFSNIYNIYGLIYYGIHGLMGHLMICMAYIHIYYIGMYVMKIIRRPIKPCTKTYSSWLSLHTRPDQTTAHQKHYQETGLSFRLFHSSPP